MEDLMTQVHHHNATAKAAAAEELIHIAIRHRDPKPGDAQRLIELADYFCRPLETIHADLELLARAHELRETARRAPEYAAAAARFQAKQKLIVHRRNKAIEAAFAAEKKQREELAATHAAGFNRFAKAREAEAQLSNLLPRLTEILGGTENAAGFQKLYDPEEIGRAFHNARLELVNELAGEALRDGPPNLGYRG